MLEEIFGSRASMILLFIKTQKLPLCVSKKILRKRFGCSQVFIPETCKKSCSNTLYLELYKKDKHVDLSMYLSNLQIVSDFVNVV
jgi:hypothetical protein